MNINNLEEATEALRKLKIELDAQKHHENLAKTHKVQVQTLELALEQYANTKGFTDLQATPAGSFGFIPTAPGVNLKKGITLEIVIAALQEANLTQFLRTKTELDKVPIGNAFKNNSDFCIQLKSIGITYEPGLTFKCEV